MGEECPNTTLRIPSRSYTARKVYWKPGNLTCDDRDREVNLKLYSAFEGVKYSYPFKRIIFQFWRPLAVDGGRLVLQSCTNAFAVSPFNRLLRDKYRVCSMKYQYRIDDDGWNEGDRGNPGWIISGGPVVPAFLNHFPEVVLDLRAHRRSPLVVCALECDLTCCVMIPVFYDHSSECVGVVECSMNHPALLLPIFNELSHELKRVGMSIYHVQGSWPYKTISGDLEPAKIEIEKALEMACESHDFLTLAQVWIPYEKALENDESKQIFLVKLSGYSVSSYDDPLSSIKNFYDKFDVISLKTREGLAWKTIETHQPHWCRNIYKLSDNRGVLALLSANTKSKCASFVICLRSIHTGDLDYAFEFFWPHTLINHFNLLGTLLSTLNTYLPSFKFVSGEQLGAELFVVDVENSSSGSDESRLVKVKALKKTRTLVGVKRKYIAGQSDLNQSNQYPSTNIINPPPEDDDDDDDLAILAAYRNEAKLIYLPSSSTLENVMEKLNNEFELDPARTYTVEYEAYPGKWSNLACLESCRRIKDTGLIRLRVLANGREVGWRWRIIS